MATDVEQLDEGLSPAWLLVSLVEVRKPPALSTGQLQRNACQAARQEPALPCNHVNGFGGRFEKTYLMMVWIL